ncbi:MAG: single-stranded-DNA-specific exonuclease RecJ, partial [Thermoflexales bacterium]
MNPSELAAALRVHPLIAEVLLCRGCDTPEAARAFLDPNAYTPTDPLALPNMACAVHVLREAIAQQRRLRVWGDFDADGQTATAVLLIGLRAMGAQVDFTIPDRARHGHGLNEEGIVQAAEADVELLITCDCGIADVERVALAQQHGMSVIVTDHHDIARDAAGRIRLPPAAAVLNPKLLDADHPFATLPGVGVAWLLVAALARSIAATFDPLALLDLVAIGIVADVAIQRKEARYLLQRGLQQLRRQPRLGVRALMRSAGVEPSALTEDTIAFKLAPRLNAAGRLRTADLGVRLLISQDETEAAILASEIEALNLERQTLQQRVEQEALAMLAQDPSLAEDAVIVLYSTTWPPSLLGVAASAVVGATGKPAILIAGQPGEVARASARSVEGVDIHAAIAAQSHLIEGGGGHPMAAGFHIRLERISAFREAINREVARQLAARGEPPPLAETFPVAWR